MTLSACDKSVLMSVDSPVAARGELHGMTMDGGMMKMRDIERIDIAASRTNTFEPGGPHVMRFRLKRPLKPGGKVPLALIVRRGDRVLKFTVPAEVRAVTDSPSHHH